MTIRTKLTLQFAVIFSFILVLFSIFIYVFVLFYQESDFQQNLKDRANIVAHVYLDANQVSQETYRKILRQYNQSLPYEIVNVYDATGKLVFQEGDGSLPISKDLIARLQQGHEVMQLVHDRQLVGIPYFDTKKKQQYSVIASSIDVNSKQQLRELRLILTVGCLLAVVIVLAAGWVFARQALRPITKVVKEVEKISASDLHLRLTDSDGKDELSHLAHTFNKMLDRLEQAFAMQKTFISNASHELRTPLTAMIGELEVALMKPRGSHEYERVLHATLDEAKLLTQLSNGLLQIAQASFDISKIELNKVRFDEVVFLAGEEVKKRHRQAKIEINFENLPEDESRLICLANESLLLIAFINVFENACKFSPEQGLISATIHVNLVQLQLRVQDRGVGIKNEDLQHVFVPFFRADNVRDISGHGIGLPLAEKIIKLHQGTIEVHSALHVGTEVIISLPANF
ncbi:HAMP domain-containing sensor histidine kinase [Adhaeribacter radiodurans]|uniref:histidine kinase n=1 Tax=Adhaeribacter radiodurans TaxID=2745197 RepID=A0A7L7L8G6_9BACT|nr:ATP-binding protein [Adhaeribacter radiodurans]QMU29111.1 HAMP domain-containing protein [Adhaeribacter radiodurans]